MVVIVGYVVAAAVVVVLVLLAMLLLRLVFVVIVLDIVHHDIVDIDPSRWLLRCCGPLGGSAAGQCGGRKGACGQGKGGRRAHAKVRDLPQHTLRAEGETMGRYGMV